MSFDQQDIARVAGVLTAMERERLTGWEGPAGAAYNTISEDLCEMGLLNSDWSLSPRGVKARDYLNRRENEK